ncbi:hypothetical protein JCM10207_008007 [Rhodosporidiobolus poonsookiae]
MSVTTPLRTRTLSHLLLSGLNPLSPPPSYSSPAGLRQTAANPSLSPIPFYSWLGAVGREQDADHFRFLPHSTAGGAGHSLLAYRNYDGTDRVFALGRNAAGELGVGFASQEGTRGLVEGFEGEEVLATQCSVQASYLLVRSGPASTSLYSFGNLARGRLGHPRLCPPAPLDAHEQPRQHVLPRATEIRMPEGMGRIRQIAAGFEHLLVLTEDGDIYGTGCNTDGQLGLGASASPDDGLSDVYELTKIPLPSHIRTHEGGVKRISAGADTSALVTESGKVWSWGNSEYCQALHGRKIDQIPSPLEIDASFLPSPSRRIVDFRCGGSFSLVLDDRGSVYSAGYGALGLGRDTLSTARPRVVEALEGWGVSRIRAGWGYAAAVRDAGSESALFSWGLNTPHGRLGLGALPPSSSSPTPSSSSSPSPRRHSDPLPPVPPHVYTPTEVDLEPALRALDVQEGGRWGVGEVELGGEGMWVTVDEEVEA